MMIVRLAALLLALALAAAPQASAGVQIDRDQARKAIAMAENMLRNESASDAERSLAYEVRGNYRFDLDGDPSARADDLFRALELEDPCTERASGLVVIVGDLLLEAGRRDEALALAETHAASFPSKADAALLKALALAGLGEIERAISAIGPRNAEGDSLSQKHLRYGLLVAAGRYADARAALDSFGEDVYYDRAIEREREILDSMERRGASPQERARRGSGFAAHVDKLLDTPTLEERVPFTGYDHCLPVMGGAEEVKLVLEFDTDTEGRTRNVRVAETENACFNRAAVETVRHWRYAPRMWNGEKLPREGVLQTVYIPTSG